MTPFAFDTLSASKRLREAGMAEGVAEAVVAVFQHATASVDLSKLATKADLAGLATKADIADMATKADTADMATKADLERFATKVDLDAHATETKAEFIALRAEIRTAFSDFDAKLSQRLLAYFLSLGGLMISLAFGAAAFVRFSA
jgi:hypothetical protein